MSETPSDAKSTSTSSANGGEEMTMFHVVFVMNPPVLEYHTRIGEMYENVVKKLAKALKYEQASSGYVWNEARKILSMKATARDNGVFHPPDAVPRAYHDHRYTDQHALADVAGSLTFGQVHCSRLFFHLGLADSAHIT